MACPEALSAAGIDNILITSPVVGPAAVERLAAFARERYGKTVLELAARWVLDRPGVSVTTMEPSVTV